MENTNINSADNTIVSAQSQQENTQPITQTTNTALVTPLSSSNKYVLYTAPILLIGLIFIGYKSYTSSNKSILKAGTNTVTQNSSSTITASNTPGFTFVPDTTPPKTVDLGKTLPVNFITSIPIEKDVTLSQSYTKEYRDKVQMSIVFPSKLTKEENYAIYEKYMKNNTWNYKVGTKTEKSLSLDGTKDTHYLNVLLMKNSATSTKETVKSLVIINLARMK